ncbi:GvpL/GvpF family gas vesicle protein [Nonomuraea spiralis]|uniref:GvpL/GvpF family gas vesicle protein n=1 Tax=Nonomuraea TaxID=83681 RepID=UPI000F76C9A2|nr:GvpL/GvpF family gas vesicle protein [Nonomuraea sp. WAC 01424]RSN04185.1 gas vesicle synthesis GvpLF [Nonomuraea sp. WAC 01424]
MATDQGVYLYAVTRDEGEGPDGLTGVAGAPVRRLTHRDLAAFFSTVSLAEFGEEALRRSMEDLAWLEETARTHHRVVEAVAALRPTAPVRLVTVYTGEAQVRELLDERHEQFDAVLARVAGRREWGVKAYAVPGRAEPVADPQDAAPGAAYLNRRRAALRGREADWRRAAEHARAVHEALMDVAVVGRCHRAQDPQLSGRREQMVLNGAYLVDDERAAEFAQVIEDVAERGVTVELVGPWAPYSFAALDQDGEAARGDAP